jgi:ATP-dependent exoDNAse (exonuclease V) beta subunit
MVNIKNFKVYRAGAGSGKTFQLTKQLLLLALGSDQPDYYKHILAITFTNAAAQEMRHRFKKALLELAQSQLHEVAESPMGAALIEASQLEPTVLVSRAKACFQHVLHHYDLLSIGTIDSFAQRLVRSFAFELEIPSDFAVELDLDAFYQRVIDRCLDDVGIKQELSEYLTDFVLGRLEDESTWKAKDLLENCSKLLRQEMGLKVAEGLKEKETEFFRLAGAKARTRKAEMKRELTALASKALDILKTYSSDANDYYYTNSSAFSKLVDISRGAIPSTYQRLKTAGMDGVFFSKTSAFALTTEHADQLGQFVLQIMDYLEGQRALELHLCQEICKQIGGLGILKEITLYADETRQEERILLINDLHQKVFEVVKEQTAPFLFERLGVKYKHILVDEFQDTSQMQWANLLPLYINALGEGNVTMVVGDAKQSIYRFRGGDVRQFIDLPQVKISGQVLNESSLFAAAMDENVLDTNRRSAPTIVSFNNALHKTLASQLGAVSEVYRDVEQKMLGDAPGWVTAQQMDPIDFVATAVSRVEEALQNNFLPHDIAILTRGKELGRQVAAALIAKGIQVQSEESLLLSNSPRVVFIGFWLRWLEQRNQTEAILGMVVQLQRINHVIELNDFCEGRSKNDWSYSQAWEVWVGSHCPNLLLTSREDIYGEALRVVSCLRWELDVFLEFFLDLLYRKSKREFLTRYKWNQWWQVNAEKASIKVASNPKAVRVMTAHKSKGLEFPVVIYGSFISSQSKQEEWYQLKPNEYSIDRLLWRVSMPKKSKDTSIWLNDDHLRQQNDRHVEAALLDIHNLHYVATTRAKQVLHLMVGKSFQEEQLWVGIQSVSEVTSVAKGLEWGAAFQVSPKELIMDAPALPLYLADGHHPKTDTSMRSTQEQDWGILVHQCMSAIERTSDVEFAVNRNYQMSRHGEWISKTELSRQLQLLVTQPALAQWFDKAQQVWMERALLLPNGDMLRPDRVVKFDDQMVVIDYKTGQASDRYDNQVRQYKEALKQMNPTSKVSGFLWFLESNSIAEVV